ncbi:MAG: fatty acid desaturase [Alphaproteobacteria bacterium]|nr:fatty acid desaturase [Alphaproteobacteria bacterium]
MFRNDHHRVEWPTLGLAIAVYAAWLLLTWFHAALPWPLLLAGGAWTVAWHASLQHELIHGHPTRHRRLNRALGLPPLLPHLPFDRYCTLHLAHHRDERLTDPLDDPEADYVTLAEWRRLGPAGRMAVRVTRPLAGRLVIGPLWSVARFVYREICSIRRDVEGVRRAWAWHMPALTCVLIWLVAVCGMSVWTYAVCFWLPGLALLLLRSFAEHRAAPVAAHCTAVVEHAPILGLLFLFNNLHAAHHERPGLAWYKLPAWYARERDRLLAKNGGLVYHGYAEVLRRYLLAPHDQPVHPQYGTGRHLCDSCGRPSATGWRDGGPVLRNCLDEADDLVAGRRLR